jgi:hypothetical protein
MATIRERQLTSTRPKDGTVTAARMVEDADGIWTTYVRLSWRLEEWLIVLEYTGTAPRKYKSASLGVEHIRHAYRYFGRIILETERRHDSPSRPKRRSDTL